MTRTLERISTVDQVATALETQILSGALPPGSRLREEEIANRLGVSRNTLREALQRLTQAGLVDHRPHRGAAVALPTAAELSEVYRIRRSLEPSALERVDDERLERLGVTADALEEAAEEGDWERVSELDVRFHAEIVAALASDRLDAFFLSLLSTLRLAFIAADRSSARAARPEHVGQHRRILEALGEGEVAQAKRLLVAHLDAGDALVRAVIRSTDEAVNA